MAYQQILKELAKLNPETKILAVSKLQTIEKIKSLYSLGQRDFAENYVQEALEKISDLQDLKINWHLIGHLQKNKAKMILGKFSSIQSVDSVELAQIINRKSAELGQRESIFLQINFAGEASKQGFSVNELDSVIPEIKNLKSLDIVGIMTMPPLAEDAENSRPYFSQARRLRDELKSEFPKLFELSMGTSSDYMVAAQEGATWVRLGTMLFGERPQK